MTSVLNVDSIAAKDGTSPVELTKQQAAKAYVLFKGTSTLAIRKSFNCSSVTDNDTGDYRPNWTSVFDSVNYINAGSCIGSPETNGGTLATLFGSGDVGFAAGSVDLSTRDESGNRFDVSYVHLISFGDLA